MIINDLMICLKSKILYLVYLWYQNELFISHLLTEILANLQRRKSVNNANASSTNSY